METIRSVRDQVIALAKLRIAPSAIAVQVNRTPATVYHYIREARKAGEDIPKFAKGKPGKRRPTTVSISAEATRKLRPVAHRRGLTVRELTQHLVEVIAADNLVASVLDDGVKDA